MALGLACRGTSRLFGAPAAPSRLLARKASQTVSCYAPQARSSAWLSLRWPASTPCRMHARLNDPGRAHELSRRPWHAPLSAGRAVLAQAMRAQVQQLGVTCRAATALLGSRLARGKLVFPISRDVLPKKVWVDGCDLKCWAGPGRASCQRVDQRPRRGCRPVAVPAAGHDAGWRAGGLGLFRRPPAAAAVLAQRQRETQGSASSNQSRAGTAGGAPHLRAACA